MRRLAVLLAVPCLLLFAPAAGAAISQATATATAQAYNSSECGFSASWVCANSRYIPAYCYAYGNTRWYCSGTVQEAYWLQLVKGTRLCAIDTQVGGNSNTIVYHYNECRH